MSICNDASFGPVSDCRVFDFTLLFEASILSILPSCLTISLASPWLYHLIFQNRPLINRFRYLPTWGKCYYIGLISTALLLCASCIATLSTFSSDLAGTAAFDAQVASYSLTLITSIILSVAIHFEFHRTLRNGPLIPLYLAVTTICDAARLRTYAIHYLPSHRGFVATFAVGMVLRIILFFLTAVSKNEFVIRAEDDPKTSAEETATFLNRLFLIWMDPLLLVGFKKQLDIDSLGPIETRLSASQLYEVAKPHWELAKGGPYKHPLVVAAFKSFWPLLLAPVPATVLYSLAVISPTPLIADVINFIQSYQNGNTPQSINVGYGLIGAYFLVFLIQTLAYAWYNVAVVRSGIAIRGFLIEAIYRKALTCHMDVAKEVGAGSTTSYMSVDSERIVTSLAPIHSFYGALITIGVGFIVIYSQLGIAFVATIIGTVIFFVSLPILARTVTKKQTGWSAETDARVKLINSIVRQITAVKLNALEYTLIRKINELRITEVTALRTYLKPVMAVSAFTNAAQAWLTICTLVTYSLVSYYSSGHQIDTAKFFASVAVLAIITEPMLMLGQQYAGIMAAWASVIRIETFLLRDDKQCIMDRPAPSRQNSNTETEKAEEDEKSAHIPTISVREATFGTKDLDLLSDLSIDFPQHGLTAVIGPVGSGKSTLLHALLGEVDRKAGVLNFPSNSSVAFTSQDAWLRTGDTVKANIRFVRPTNPIHYKAVVKATALDVDFKIWPQGDQQQAQGLSGGQAARVALARALYSKADIYLLDDPLAALDHTTETHCFKSLFGERGMLRGKTVILATNSPHHLTFASHIVMLGPGGKIVEQGSFSQAMSHDGPIKRYMDTHAEGATEQIQSGIGPAGDTPTDTASTFMGSIEATKKDIDAEMAAARHKQNPLISYVHAGGSWSFALGMLLLTVNAGIYSSSSIYIQAWTTAIEAHGQSRLLPYMGGYVAYEIMWFINFTVGLVYLFIVYVPRAGIGMHNKEIKSLLSTSLSYFVDVPIGRILSRFSQDVNIMDFKFPNHFINFYALASEVVATCVIIIIAAPWTGIVLVVSIIVLGGIQRFYVKTSSQVRRIDAITKSPIYTLFAETIDPNGLKTIRALKVEEELETLASKKLNMAQVPFYLMETVRKWFTLVLGLVVVAINTVLVGVAVATRSSANAGILAVALVQATSLASRLNLALTSLAEFEITLVAIHRIQEVIELPPEEPETQMDLPASPSKDKDLKEGNWLRQGSVRFDNVSLRYRPELPLALKNLSFSIPSGTRVGICGRSGGGKSTILQALFRMVDIEPDGAIYLDAHDIRSMSRHNVRAAMQIVPQDPLLLELTLRENLDFSGTKTDEEIWSALERTHCKSFVEVLPAKLDAKVTGSGGNFSRGQRQLLALARATLLNTKIVCLDEISSSLDLDTDNLIQAVIKEAFSNSTVITIAHRLETILDYDTIVVMGAGKIVEMGPPQALLENSEGAFSSLVKGEQ